MRSLLIALLLHATTALPAAATLSGAKMGEHVLGPQLSIDQLKGQVVFWEYWGVNCPPCRTSIAHLVELKAELGNQVTMIANHCQQSDPANIRKVWMDNGGDDSITVVDFGDLPGNNVSGIPKCFVFDHTGKLVYEGSPFKVDDALREACANAPGSLVADREWIHLRREAFAIGRQQSSIGGAIGSVRKATKNKDATIKAEADELLARVETWAQEKLSEAQVNRTTDPLATWETANHMANLLKGDDLSDSYRDFVKELKNDRTFQEEVKAASALAKLVKVAKDQGVDSGNADARVSAACRKALEQIRKKYEGTVAAEQAVNWITEWNL